MAERFANSEGIDQTLQNKASYLGLCCLGNQRLLKDLGHMTKMIVMSIYGKKILNASSPELKDLGI